MSFTPGPWTYHFAEGGGYDCMTDSFLVVGADPTQFICDIDLSHFGQSWRHVSNPLDPERVAEAEADARLIAAAPELYAALKAMLDGAYGNPSFPDENAAVDAAADAAIAKAEGRTGAVEAA